ncbi:MAG: SRPBCC family protein [Gemmatimonadota bacterium]
MLCTTGAAPVFTRGHARVPFDGGAGMKWILLALAGLFGLVLLLVAVGLLRPRDHVARTRVHLATSAVEAWAVLADLDRWDEWSPDIESMERLPDRDGRPVWRARGKWGEPTEVRESDPPRLLRTFVDGGSFQGTWTYELEPEGGGSRLTITEHGEVGNPFFRGMMVFRDEGVSMRAFLAAFGTRLGESVRPETLREPRP